MNPTRITLIALAATAILVVCSDTAHAEPLVVTAETVELPADAQEIIDMLEAFNASGGFSGDPVAPEPVVLDFSDEPMLVVVNVTPEAEAEARAMIEETWGDTFAQIDEFIATAPRPANPVIPTTMVATNP